MVLLACWYTSISGWLSGRVRQRRLTSSWANAKKKLSKTVKASV